MQKNNKDKRILIFGASGSIGLLLYNKIKLKYDNVYGTYNSSPKTDLIKCNLINSNSVLKLLKVVNPTHIIYAAGEKNIENCQKSIELANSINSEPIRTISNSCLDINIKPFFIYISSDYIFEGKRGSYNYSSNCNPLSNYGISKHNGEKLSLNLFKNRALIIRSSALMIENSGFFGWLKSNLKEKKPIKLYTNTKFTPTSSNEFCVFISDLLVNDSILKRYKPIVHFTSGIEISRYKFAIQLAKKITPNYENLIIPDICDFNKFQFYENLSMCNLHENKIFNSNYLDIDSFL